MARRVFQAKDNKEEGLGESVTEGGGEEEERTLRPAQME
jgi:hypothetical protein